MLLDTFLMMKPSEFYRRLFELDARKDALVEFAEDALQFGRSVRVQSDSDGVTEEVVRALEEYQRMLDEGPPDGSPMGGAATASPERGKVGWPKGRKRGPRKVRDDRPDPNELVAALDSQDSNEGAP